MRITAPSVPSVRGGSRDEVRQRHVDADAGGRRRSGRARDSEDAHQRRAERDATASVDDDAPAIVVVTQQATNKPPWISASRRVTARV
jgi:hypothetical protein